MAEAGVLDGDVQRSMDRRFPRSPLEEIDLLVKLGLLWHLDFDMDKHLEAVHPGVEHMLVSARSGEGIEGFRDCLRRVGARIGAPA